MKTNRSWIQSFFLLLIFCMMIIVVNAVLAAEEWSVPDHEPQTVDSIAWAENVRDNKVGANVGAKFSNPAAVLGEDDAVPGQSGIYSLGNALADSPQPPLLPSQCEAYLIVDFGKNAIVDGDGTDIGVFEVAANGVAEATWVYIGKDVEGSEEWLYAGKTGGSIEGIDISGVGDPGEQFNLVALCDFPDGYSSGWPVGGPDIDAIAALNFSRIGMVVEPEGPGWSKNDEPLEENKNTLLDPGDTIEYRCPSGYPSDYCSLSRTRVKALCGIDNYVELMSWIWVLKNISFEEQADFVAHYSDEELDLIFEICNEQNGEQINALTEPVATFVLQQGGMGFAVEYEQYPFELQTPVAVLKSSGLNNFSATYDPDADESIVTVIGGSLNIAPTALGQDPFTLNAGQQVTISADGPDPIIDLAFIYLPVTSKP